MDNPRQGRKSYTQQSSAFIIGGVGKTLQDFLVRCPVTRLLTSQVDRCGVRHILLLNSCVALNQHISIIGSEITELLEKLSNLGLYCVELIELCVFQKGV